MVPISEPTTEDFEEGAIFVRSVDEDGIQKVTSRDGKRVLWEREFVDTPPLDVPTLVSKTVDAVALRQARASGMSIKQIAKTFGIARSTVQRHTNVSNDNHAIPRINPDFSGVENTQLPYSVRSAIQLSLETVAQNAILAEERQVKSFFEGYLSGFTSALAIICGAGGIDLSFLEERRNDDSTSNTEQ